MNILEHIDQIPPCICRMVARKMNGRRGLSHREIARICGISKSTVANLSVKASWRGVKIEVISAFAKACGVDFSKPADVRKYLRTYKKMHVLNCHGNRKKMFAKIFSLERMTDQMQAE